MSAHLEIYIGTTNDLEDFIYLDLRTPEKEFTLEASTDDLHFCGEQDFIDSLEEIVETAEQLSRCLNLPVRCDRQEFKEVIEEFSDEKRREVINILKGVE